MNQNGSCFNEIIENNWLDKVLLAAHFCRINSCHNETELSQSIERWMMKKRVTVRKMRSKEWMFIWGWKEQTPIDMEKEGMIT